MFITESYSSLYENIKMTFIENASGVHLANVESVNNIPKHVHF